MRFEDRFTVTAPVEEVWKALLDVERVAPCMPGAQVLQRVDDDTYRVAIRVKVGPVSMRYRGEVEVVARDDEAHTATMHVKAKETRGQGTADADVHMALADDGAGTAAAMDTEVQLSGKAAAMGQGVIAGVSARLVETFARNLAAMLEGDGAQPARPTAPPHAVGPRPAAADAAAPRPVPPGAPPPGPAPTEAGPARAAPPGAPPAATAEPPRPVAAPAAEDAALPVGRLLASALLARLREPRALAALGAVLVAAAGLVGFRVGRRQGTARS